MSISPISDTLMVKGNHSFLIAAPVLEKFPLCVEFNREEIIQAVNIGDIVVVSAPNGGDVKPALMLLELVRTFHLPLIVLSKDHPGSKRIPYVVSVAPVIQTNCSIIRGTHPEQHLICSSDELAGIEIQMSDAGIKISPLPIGVTIEKINLQ